MVNIKTEELVELKEKSMTDAQIVEYFSKQGKKISITTVHVKLTDYYHSIGKTKPRGRSIIDDELVKMKEENKTDREISEYFTKQGRKISLCSVNKRLNKHYRSKSTTKPRAKVRMNFLIKKEISNEEILKLRKQGMSFRAISEYLKTLGKDISHCAIKNRIKRMSELEELGRKEQEDTKMNLQNEFKASLKIANISTLKEENRKSNIKFEKDDKER